MSNTDEEHEDGEDPAIVLDVGTCYTRCGFAGENEPRSVFPTVVGRSIRHTTSVSESSQLKDLYVGNEVLERSSLLHVKNRLLNRKREIEHWNEIEKVWEHILNNELQVESPDQPVLYCEEAHLGTCKQREQIAYVRPFFFCLMQNVPWLHEGVNHIKKKKNSFEVAPLIYNNKQTNRNNGYKKGKITHCCLIVLGYKGGGHHVTRYLMGEMNRVLDTEHKLDPSRIFDIQVVTDIKRQNAHFIETLAVNRDSEIQADDSKIEEKTIENPPSITLDIKSNYSRRQTMYEEKLSHSKLQKNVRYELPDGYAIRIEHRHLWECTENTFFTADGLSLDRELHSFITGCNKDFRHVLWTNIILAGNTTKVLLFFYPSYSVFASFLPGLDNKLKGYLQSATTDQKIDIWGPDVDKLDLVWLGGSVVADIYSAANDFWVSASEYEETGPNIVHRNSFAQKSPKYFLCLADQTKVLVYVGSLLAHYEL
ncbi:actin-related protein [Reticulomyxa filosa]|uniref:Actin-related protein n=1 Tax=Reticulomyxa filosa TaxID=46433 RepID=X6NAF8_RETFI|nr:actin-related protein [Reticulomyxa filosa]|eukprot:ETO22754.1 actin-related protein [Reticulomyxa filosa]